MRRIVFAFAAGFAAAVQAVTAPQGFTIDAVDYSAAACNLDCAAVLRWTSPGGGDKIKVYRFTDDTNAQPPAVVTIDSTATSFTDTSAVVGRLCRYAISAYDSTTGEESELTDLIDYRRVEQLSKYGGLSYFGNLQNVANGSKIEAIRDGTTDSSSYAREEQYGNFAFRIEFTSPIHLAAMRVFRPYNFWSAGVNPTGWEVSSKINGATVHPGNEAGGRWNVSGADAWSGWDYHLVLPQYADTEFSYLDYNAWASGYGATTFELEYYGWAEAKVSALAAAMDVRSQVENNAVTVSWTAGKSGDTFAVYRRVKSDEPTAWTRLAAGLSATTYTDTTAAFNNINYEYAIGEIAANGDMALSAVTVAFCGSSAVCWWDFLNVKSFVYAGAGGWSDPAQARPHFLARDAAGTTLVGAMGVIGYHPVMAFNLGALADGIGELTHLEAGAQSWFMYDGAAVEAVWRPQGYEGFKGAAATEDLIFVVPTASTRTLPVIERATGAATVYTFASGTWVGDGGLSASADGNYLYSNDRSTRNRIHKFAIDRANRVLREVAAWDAEGFTRIRNLAVYTVGAREVAFFGEGGAAAKIAMMDLTDGTVTTLVNAAAELANEVTNVKLAVADGDKYLVAQGNNGAVNVYKLNDALTGATLVKAIDAATMKGLYGAEGTQYHNLEMTADGRYAFVMCDAGAETRLSVIGATVKTVPEAAPLNLSAVADGSTKCKATLAWENVAGVTADGVRVLRAQTGKAGYAAVEDLPLSATGYTDETAVAGVAYTYAVAYVNTYEGRTITGPAAVSGSVTPLKEMTKAGNWSTPHSFENGNLANLTDGNITTFGVAISSTHVARHSIAFTQPVVPVLVRVVPGSWGSPVNACTVLSGDTALGSERFDTMNVWYDIALSGNDAVSSLTLSVSGDYYLKISEVELYGYSKTEADAEAARPSEAAVTVAPEVAINQATAGLAWNEDAALKVAAVKIYRARSPEGPFMLVGEVAGGDGAWTDAGAVKGVAYYYQTAFVTECQGVRVEGARSAAQVMTKATLITENGKTKTLGEAVGNTHSGNRSQWYGNAFDGNTATYCNWFVNDEQQFVGYNFNQPWRLTGMRFHAMVWAAGRNTDLGLYVSPNKAGYLSEDLWARPADAVLVGEKSPALKTDDIWQQGGFVTDPVSCAYIFKPSHLWYANCKEIEFYGITDAEWQAARAAVIWPVENVAAAMDGAALTLSWEAVGKAATAVTVKRRTADGAWEEVATLAGDATTWTTTDAVAVGEHNAYRIEVTDGAETVWTDFAVRPLLTQGARTAVGCDATSAWDYLTLADVREIIVNCTVGAAVPAGAAAALEVRSALDAAPLATVALTGAGKYRLLCVGDKVTAMKQTDGAWSVVSETDAVLPRGAALVGVRVTADAIADVGKVAIGEVKVSYPGTIVIVR